MDTQAPTRKPRGLKIAIIIVAVLLLLFAGFIYLLPQFLPIGTIKGIVKSNAAQMAGLDVDFQTLRFGWNGDVVLEQITVAPLTADGTPGERLLAVDSVRTNVALMPLLSGKAIVNSMEVDGFALTVKKDADGNLNLPDFSALAAETQASAVPAKRPAAPMALSAVAEQTPAAALPPIELHRLDLKNGTLGYADPSQNIDVAVGLESMRLEGKTLDDPFTLSGRILPYPENPELGEIPFQGRIAMLKNLEVDFDGGEASIEIDVSDVSLHEMAQKAGIGELLASGKANGLIKIAYADRKAGLHIAEMNLADTNVGLGDALSLDIPDTVVSLNAQFDPQPATVTIDDMSLTNEIAALRGRGLVDSVNDFLSGGFPAITIDFSGMADFAKASDYLTSRDLGLGDLPKLNGNGRFVGTTSLPAAAEGEPLSPTLSIRFEDGNVDVVEASTQIAAGLALKNLALQAAGTIGNTLDLNATVALANTPGHAVVPQLGGGRITFALNGGAAATVSGDAIQAELRLEESNAVIPATPWSGAANVRGIKTRITADLAKDAVEIHGMEAKVNDGIEAAVPSARFSGILAGAPEGQAALQLSALFAPVSDLIQPLLPQDLIQQAAGTLQASSTVKLANGSVEAQTLAEIDSTQAIVTMEGMRAELQAPKSTIALIADLNLAEPDVVAIRSLEIRGEGATFSATDSAGASAAGQLSGGIAKIAGVMNLASLLGEFTEFTTEANGLAVRAGKPGEKPISLTSGIIKAVVATPEGKISVPLSGEGDFALPSLSFGMDNLAFAAGDEQAALGNLRVAMAIDGYIGAEKRQLINLRSASIAASPLAVNSRGQIDLGTGAMLAEYAARIAPAGITPVLTAMGLPPALLTDLAVTGAVSYSDNQVNSKGGAQGTLRMASGETSPFEMAHDLSAAWNLDEQSLALDIRRLDGNVKTASGEAVATMAAQQSRLLLSRAGSKGLLDIRVKGSAGPTRMLLLGVVGVVPQLAEYSQILYNAQADGIYEGWLQIRDKDAATLSLNLGGTWQGAALTLGGVPYLAEADKLSGGLEGEFAYKDNQVRLSRMLFRSNSAMMQADGQAVVTFTSDAANTPNGLANISTSLQFVLADLAKAAMVFPGIVPGNLGLAGRVDGILKAGGNANDIRIEESALRFQGFRAIPAQGAEFTIQSGAASFGGDIALTPDAANGSMWDTLKIINVRNGQAALTGAALNGNVIDEMAASFQLESGVLALNSAKIAIAKGAAGSLSADGRIDFNYPLPQASARWSMQNLPIPLGATPEIVTMEGELAIQDNNASLPKFYLQTASGLIQASGAGNAVFTFDEAQMPNGLSTVQIGMRFALADLARLAALAPDIVPQDLGLAGRIEGAFTAAGNGNDIRIGEAVMNFQGFQAVPAADTPLVIQSGAANFTGSIGLNLQAASTGSPYDVLRMINVRNGQARLTGAVLRDKPINEMGAAFQLENGVLSLQSAQLTIGGGAGGSVMANGGIDFNSPAPVANIRVAMRNIPLSEFNSEIKDYMTIQSGVLNIPAQGDAASIGFAGFSEDEILQTLRLDNFSFATGPVVLHTGPVLNAELDRARAILKMDSSKDGTREISFSSITGTATAAGTGVIAIPDEAPINLIGENTADFRARGNIKADHTMDMKVMVAGKMENIISISLPNIIPTLKSGDDGQTTNRLLNQMNASAAKGDYGVHVKGSLESPDISGIGALAGQLLQDIIKSSGMQILGGALDLGKDTPEALVNLGGAVVGGVLNPGETVKNAPENIIKTPENVLKGLGQAFGIRKSRDSQDNGEQQPEEGQEQNQEGDRRDRNRLQLPFGIH